MLPSIALFRRDPWLQKLQRIKRSHHGPRQSKTCGQGLAPVGLDAGKTLLHLSKKLSIGIAVDHFWITSESCSQLWARPSFSR